MTNARPSAPAPRSSPSDAQCLAAMREFSAQKGESHDAMWDQVSAEDKAEILSEWRAILECAEVASYGERGGGLEEAARECDKYAYEARGAATGLPSFPEVRERLWAKADAAEELARCIRALSSSPPSAGA